MSLMMPQKVKLAIATAMSAFAIVALPTPLGSPAPQAREAVPAAAPASYGSGPADLVDQPTNWTDAPYEIVPGGVVYKSFKDATNPDAGIANPQVEENCVMKKILPEDNFESYVCYYTALNAPARR